MKLNTIIQTAQTQVENLFKEHINQTSSPSLLNEVIGYALLNGGKRLRPALIYITGQALGAEWDSLAIPAMAIELIHTYSLIHDDLPAMDNADLRRGRPTCHKKYGDAAAILAGDAIQTLAFNVLATQPGPLTAEQRIHMVAILSQASGMQGMAGGQMLDMEGVHSIESITHMYQLKTGALLTACVKLAAIAAHIKDPQINASLETFANNIGLAFQIQDDLLDIDSPTETIGKPAGLDLINQKITYPVLIGIEETRAKVRSLFAAATSAIAPLGEKAGLLHTFAEHVLQRKK